jgi:hypothetical protein
MPGHWPIPALKTSSQLFVWFFLLIGVVLFLLIAGVWCMRRDRSRFEARVLLAVALFSIGILPQGMQRVDSAHFAWVSCVPFAFVPVAVLELMRGRALKTEFSYRRRAFACGAGALVVMLLAVPQFTGWAYTDYVAQTFDRHRLVFEIERNGRIFYYGRPEVASAAHDVLAEVPKWAEEGDRLFVGTTDLRKTPLSEAYLYYLLPEYPPATYFIEMDPGVANRKGSRLADDLRSADIAILSSAWNDWDEPNDSRKLGSVVPNRVLAREFCVAFATTKPDQIYRTGEPIYTLLVKRPRGQPCPEGTTVPKPPGV